MLIATAGIIAFNAIRSNSKADNATTNTHQPTNSKEIDMSNSKILVAYYSATNNTKRVTEQIAQKLDEFFR